MPDPTISIAAIQSHVSALSGSVERHLTNARRYKASAAVIVAGMILLMTNKPQWAALPWAAGAVVLLAYADACCVALTRRAGEAYNRFMARVPLNGGNMPKAEEWLVLPKPDLGIRDAGCVIRAFGSFTVWPFYGALLALIVGFHIQMSHSAEARVGDLDRGKAGESARLLPSAATQTGTPARPASGTVTTSVPMKVIPRTPTPNTSAQPAVVSPPNAPGSPAANAPGGRVPLGSSLRLPTAPPNASGTPALQPPTRVPPNAAPVQNPLPTLPLRPIPASPTATPGTN